MGSRTRAHQLQLEDSRAWAPERGLSSGRMGTQLPRGMWDPLGSEMAPASPELAGRFLTTRPQGEPRI